MAKTNRGRIVALYRGRNNKSPTKAEVLKMEKFYKDEAERLGCTVSFLLTKESDVEENG